RQTTRVPGRCRSPSCLRQSKHGLAGALKEYAIVLTFTECDRRSKDDGADKGYGKELTLRQDPPQVGDVDRHQCHVGPAAGKVVQAAAKTPDRLAAPAGALRED